MALPKVIERMPPRLRARAIRLGYNLHPAFRSTGGRVLEVSPDLRRIRITLPLCRRTRNIVGSIYGGALFAVTDGPHPTMLMAALGRDVIVWDKAAAIRYRRPAYDRLYVDFSIDEAELAEVRRLLDRDGEVERTYEVELVDRDGIVYAEVSRTVYLARKDFYQKKQKLKRQGDNDEARQTRGPGRDT